MSRTIRPLLAGILTAVALSGCSAQVSGAAVGGDAGPAVASSQQESSAPSSGEETTGPSTGPADGDVQQFVAMIADGMSNVTSYQGKLSTDLGSATGGSMTGTMRGTVKDGKVERSEATLGIVVGAQRVEVTVLTVGTRTYLGGESLLQIVPGAKDKTWIYADPDSSNPVIKRLSVSMSAAGSNSSSIKSFTSFAEAATSVEQGESGTVNGVDATAYKTVLDPSKLRSAAGTPDSATATFYLDGDNRMRRAKVAVEAGGVEVAVTMDMTDYNTPVEITAPAADTVYTG